LFKKLCHPLTVKINIIFLNNVDGILSVIAIMLKLLKIAYKIPSKPYNFIKIDKNPKYVSC